MAARRARVSTFLICLMLAHLATPFASSQPLPEIEIDTHAELDLFSTMGVLPVQEHARGWYDSSEGVGTIDLLYRDATVTSVEEWPERAHEDTLSGFYVLTHTFPVPTEWKGELKQAGIDCYSFLPPNGFSCELNKHSIEKLHSLGVHGILKIDPTDKISLGLAKVLNGMSIGQATVFYHQDMVPINLLLSGESLPEDISSMDNIEVRYHSGRFAGVNVDPNSNAIAWLANQDEIEWLEEEHWYMHYNDVADTVLKATDLWDQSTMSGIDSSWNHVDGTGIIVAVADSGLDSGTNDSTMHPDFRDHIVDIISFSMTSAEATWCGSVADDGASDIDGHGTHVAGSVLGDGTDSSGNIKGIAPEARLYFQAVGAWCANGDDPSTPGDERYSLMGLPADIAELFDPAAENGSRVHTNSWGSTSSGFGVYTLRSIQADIGARDHQNMTILFAAGNSGVDTTPSNGEIDDDSLGSPATAKNVFSVGASENDRPSLSYIWGPSYNSPINNDLRADNINGMAAFSSRGPVDDGRIKPDISAPGTYVLSTKSRSTTDVGWLAYNTSYTYMGGTSMATPLTAGATALLLEHLIDNRGHLDPSSALVKAIFAASATDMSGQYSSATNGAGEIAPNNHEGWGRVDLRNALNATFIEDESVSTSDSRGWSFNIPASAPDLNIVLSWIDPESTTIASVNLVNDLDLAIKDPSGTWTELSNDRDNLRGLKFANPAQGTWEVHVNGTSVPTGPQYFALAINQVTTLVNLTEDIDLDGYEDDDDDCVSIYGTSNMDRDGCPDSDGDGYSDPDLSWTASDGADAFPALANQWADLDLDGYGDNPAGFEPDSCTPDHGNSTIDRFGCLDNDGDGYSNNDGTWLVSNGADACNDVKAYSTIDRFGCPDSDGDGVSDPDPTGLNGLVWTVADGADILPNDASQQSDTDGDGYGDNPTGTNGDACPSQFGTSSIDRNGCLDSDSDGASDPDGTWTAVHGADAFPFDSTQSADTDGDGYGDNASGTNPDGCPTQYGFSNIDRIGCPDSDGDGISDADGLWNVSQGADAFRYDATQSADQDGDGYGDNPTGNYPDACPTEPGDSWQNATYGCPDNDGDGWSNDQDSHPDDPTQWSDDDGDGFGDNSGGTEPDACPATIGNSTKGNRYGCIDSDGDGWDDVIDELPNVKHQWLDQDADGYGDNATGPEPDACPGVAGTSTIDRFGCVDGDGDGISDENDAFPTDPDRSSDVDGDGYDDLEDGCMLIAGNSTQDRLGCTDSDGDGYSDGDELWTTTEGSDAFPDEATQHADQDGDGYGDNVVGFEADDCPTTPGSSFRDVFGCDDEDADGMSDSNDAFLGEPTQWNDADSDGYGDELNGSQGDACPDDAGTSTNDVYGCIDTDGDGYSDLNDLWPNDSSQWYDDDLDGFGDASSGTDPDQCPDEYGTAYRGTLIGCPDTDGDGYADAEDAFPTHSSQHLDTDGDGWGDNETSGAHKPDHWPNDPNKNAGDASMQCTPSKYSTDSVTGGNFIFTCTVTTSMSDGFTARIDLQSPNGIQAETNSQTMIFTSETGNTQPKIFIGTATNVGNYNLVLTVTEPGAEIAMDTVTIRLNVYNSSKSSGGEDSFDWDDVLEMPLFQAAAAAILFTFLFGMLIIRGKSRRIKDNDERKAQAAQVLYNRMMADRDVVQRRRVELGYDAVPPPPGLE